MSFIITWEMEIVGESSNYHPHDITAKELAVRSLRRGSMEHGRELRSEWRSVNARARARESE